MRPAAAGTPRSGRPLRRALTALLWLAYPLVVWAGLSLGAPKLVGLAVVALLASRGLVLWRRADAAARRRLLAPALAVGAPALAAAALGAPRLLLVAPVLVNLGLLASFGRSLLRGPPLVETVARLQVGELSGAEVRYCRTVTGVWCAFFAANALVTAAVARFGSVGAWALWTGALSYLAIALLLAIELTVRSWRFRRYTGGPTDVVMRRLFPPRPAGPAG